MQGVPMQVQYAMCTYAGAMLVIAVQGVPKQVQCKWLHCKVFLCRGNVSDCNARCSYEVQCKWLQCKVYLCSAMQDFAVAAALSQRGGRPRWQREILEYKIGNNMLESKVQSTEYRQSTMCRKYSRQRDILLLFSEAPITPSLAVSYPHQVATTYCLTLKMKRSYIDRVLSCSWIDLVLFWN